MSDERREAGLRAFVADGNKAMDGNLGQHITGTQCERLIVAQNNLLILLIDRLLATGKSGPR